MSESLNKFDILSKLKPELKKEIKVFHIFDDNKGYNVLFITSDDKVFGFGSNTYGCCGLGHNNVVNEPQVIPELCNKNIKQFFIGHSFVLAFSNDHQLFGWGQNNFVQLGRGYISGSECFKPEVIIIPNETIIEVSVGFQHSLALTLSGNVYGWGYNGHGQTGCGVEGENISTPSLVKYFDEVSIKSICCAFYRSYVLTNEGNVYIWGNNYPNSDSASIPKLINISNVISVCPSTKVTYFLSNEGLIYYFSSFGDSPKLFNQETKFSSLHFVAIYYQSKYQLIVSAVSGETIYYLNNISMNSVENKRLLDYYYENHKISYKTLNASNNKVIDEFDFTNNYNFEKEINKIKEIFEKSNEFSATDLKNIIQRKREYFGRQPNEAMNTFEYFISCQLFKELLEFLQYLHESNPPVIHGNLRPENILVYSEQTKGRFIKIINFDSNNTSNDNSIDKCFTKEDFKYMSPETNFVKTCNSTANIYSLAVIAMELFDFNIYGNIEVTKNNNLTHKWLGLKKNIISMMSPEPEKRSKCSQILLSMNEWSITPKELSECGDEDNINEVKDVNDFFQTYFNSRLMNEIDSNIFESNNYSFECSDVSFIVGEEKISSLKLLLIIKSKSFRQLFNECKDMTFVMKDLNAKAFKKMLQYIYWNKITLEENEDIDMVINVYKCADRYQVKQLMELLEDRISTSINFNSVEAIFEYAKDFNLGDLKCLAQKFLSENFEDIITKNGDQLNKINIASDNYLLPLILKYSLDQKNKNERLSNFLKPSGTDSVVIDQVEYTRVKSVTIDGTDPTLFGVKYSQLSTDLSEDK